MVSSTDVLYVTGQLYFTSKGCGSRSFFVVQLLLLLLQPLSKSKVIHVIMNCKFSSSPVADEQQQTLTKPAHNRKFKLFFFTLPFYTIFPVFFFFFFWPESVNFLVEKNFLLKRGKCENSLFGQIVVILITLILYP